MTIDTEVSYVQESESSADSEVKPRCAIKLGPLVVKGSATSPHFQVEVENSFQQLAPLDLGADASVMSLDFYEQIRDKFPHTQLISNCAKLWNVSGGSLKVHGRCQGVFKEMSVW